MAKREENTMTSSLSLGTKSKLKGLMLSKPKKNWNKKGVIYAKTT